MSTNKFVDTWERIRAETDIKTFVQLANLIGKTQQNVSAAKKRGEFSAEWAFKIEQKFGLLTSWIMTGEGPKRIPLQAAPQPPPAADPNLPAFILELNTWAREISEPPGNLKWLEKQLETCLPTWKTWREAKDEEAKKTALPTDKVA